nr:hypothetical protein [Tanacetum cinerariifolium]
MSKPRWENDPRKLGATSDSLIAWDRYKDLLRACPHHGFTELHQLDTFYNALNPADQDSLNAAAGGNLLERRTQDVLTIIKNKSKVRNSRSKSVVSQVKSCDVNSNSSSEIAKLTHAVNQPTSAMTTAMTAMLKQFQATPPPASVKAVEETCVTCGGAHPYYQCLAAGGNTFPELRDNIQGYVSAATVNYNQEGSNVRPEKLLDFDSTKDLHPLLHDIDSSLKDSIDLANPADIFVDSVPELFIDEHAFNYSSPLIFDEYDDDFLEVESDAENVYDDPFDSKGEKIKESKLLNDELDLPCDFLPSEYDLFISQDFSRVDSKPSTDNKDNIFNPGILIQEKYFEIITHVVQDKKLTTSNASFVLEDVDPPFYEPLFFKEVPSSKMLLPFSSENEEKVPGLHTSEKVHSSWAARRWLENPRVLFTLGKILSPNSSMNSFPPQEQQISIMKSLIFNNDTFYNALNPADQDSLNAAVGGNLLERRTQDVLTIIENKSKVHNSRSKSVVSQEKSCDDNSNSSSEIAKLTHAVNQQTSAVTTAMMAMLKHFQATPPPASVKAVKETCVTCGGAHPYYQCLATSGKTFPKLRDNIQGYVSAAAVNYN